MKETTSTLRPFLKWAGGKRWLLEQRPDVFRGQYERLVEPFLGGASVFFHLKPKSALISDINLELIETYLAIRNDWESVLHFLELHQMLHDHDYYYFMRTAVPTSREERAARFIYLNRTCWNGLYRVNKNGRFNVPIGTKTSVLMDSDNFKQIAKLLRNATITHCDFELTIDQAVEGDLLFVDPPYTVTHNENGFIKYNSDLFSWLDQERLRESLGRARMRGAKIITTNANHASIRKLYEGFGQSRVLQRKSVISGKNKGRGAFTELLITSC